MKKHKIVLFSVFIILLFSCQKSPMNTVMNEKNIEETMDKISKLSQKKQINAMAVITEKAFESAFEDNKDSDYLELLKSKLSGKTINQLIKESGSNLKGYVSSLLANGKFKFENIFRTANEE